MSVSVKRLLFIVIVVLMPVLAACGTAFGTPTPDLKNLQTRIAATMAAIPTAQSLTPPAPTATSTPVQPSITDTPPPPTTIPTNTPAAQKYAVQAGDTLSAIAVKFNTSIAAIQLLNNLDDARVVRQGQTLTIPSSKIAPDENPYWVVHIVEAGETLSTIAVRFNVRLDDLLRVNNISNAALTRTGDRLVIPAKGPVT